MQTDLFLYFLPALSAFYISVTTLYFYSRVAWLPFRIFCFYQVAVLGHFLRLELQDLGYIIFVDDSSLEQVHFNAWKLNDLLSMASFPLFNVLILKIYTQKRIHPMNEESMIDLMFRDYRIYISNLIFIILILWTFLAVREGHFKELLQIMNYND